MLLLSFRLSLVSVEISKGRFVYQPFLNVIYAFLVPLDPSLSSHQKISILEKKIQDLRKTYNLIKSDLVTIDRRRKKLRRRERETKKNLQQKAAAAAAAAVVH